MPLTKADARRILLSIPGAEERPHFRKAAVFVSDQFLTRVHDKENAVVIITSDIEMRDMMLEAEPKLFYITDHYRSYAALLARLALLDRVTLKQLIAPRLAQINAKSRLKKKSPAPKTKPAKRKRSAVKKIRKKPAQD
jgi:hypothetical protein